MFQIVPLSVLLCGVAGLAVVCAAILRIAILEHGLVRPAPPVRPLRQPTARVTVPGRPGRAA